MPAGGLGGQGHSAVSGRHSGTVGSLSSGVINNGYRGSKNRFSDKVAPPPVTLSNLSLQKGRKYQGFFNPSIYVACMQTENLIQRQQAEIYTGASKYLYLYSTVTVQLYSWLSKVVLRIRSFWVTRISTRENTGSGSRSFFLQKDPM